MSRILVVGLCCVDVVHYVDKFPIEDSDARVVKRVVLLGGNAANNITVLKQFTDNCEIFAALPKTDSILEGLLNEIKIDTSKCVRRNQSSECPISTVINNRTTGSRTVLHYRGDLPELTADEFEATFSNRFAEFGWIHFEGRNFEEVRRMMDCVILSRKREETHAKISVELEKIRPYPHLEQLIPLADVLFVSKDFAKNKGWNSMTEAVEAISALAPKATVICAWGDSGAAGKQGTSSSAGVTIQPAIRLDKVVDSLGAGDCFIGACLYALNQPDATLNNVLKIGCDVAGRKCTQEGLLNLNDVKRD